MGNQGNLKQQSSTATTSESKPRQRVDPPHQPASATLKETHDGSGDSQLDSLKEMVEKTRTHARQLARCLHRREKDLHRRETTLHAQAALLDRDTRGTRLWIAEQTFQINERRQTLEQPQENATAEQSESYERMSAGLVRREEQLVQAERIVLQQKGDLDARREEISRRREELERQARAERRRAADEQRRWQADVAKKSDQLERQQDELRARAAATEQMREEVLRTQRETLEYRLAIEELWGQLSLTAPPEVLTRSLGRIRGKLTNQYLIYERDLERKRNELDELSARVKQEHDRLQRHRHRLQQWSQRQEELIDERARRLVKREQELDRQEGDQEQLLLKWQDERQGYLDEIQMLTRKLRESTPAAA